MKKKITILELLKMMEIECIWDKCDVLGQIKRFKAEEFGPEKRLNFYYEPDTSYKISLRFESEKESWLTIPADHPILANYYDVVPESIEPAEENTLAIWIKAEDFFPAWTRTRR